MSDPDTCGCNEEEEEAEGLRIRAGLYFDGTLNNRFNTRNPAPDMGRGDRWMQRGTGSYENDASNISRLEEHTDDYDEESEEDGHSLTIYIEGAGTQDGQVDHMAEGAGRGVGDTGVPAKVRRGMLQLRDLIIALRPTDGILYLHVDVFGFSRGAAAARLAIEGVLNGFDIESYATASIRSLLQARGVEVSDVKVIFAGLFDTVASYGIQHSNDTAELHLTAVRHPDRTVQLGAAEEHRSNFRLTNINAAGAKGRQIFLPGVHSDVGGGYQNNSDDDVILYQTGNESTATALSALNRQKQWMLDKGFYTASQMTDTLDDGYIWDARELRGSRRVSNRYTYIPMKLMAHFAEEKGCHYKGSLQSSFNEGGALSGVRSELFAYAGGIGNVRSSTPGRWFGKAGSDAFGGMTMGEFRRGYTHWSASYGATLGANDPEWSGDHLTTGRRRRIIQSG